MYIQVGEKWISLHTNGVVHLSFTLFHFKMLILLSKECLCDKILQYLSTPYFISFTLSSMSSIIVSNVVLIHFDWCALFSNVVAVGTSAVRFPEEGDSLELYARKAKPTPGPALRGLQPGRLPWCAGGPPQHQWQVGETIHTLSLTLHFTLFGPQSG